MFEFIATSDWHLEGLDKHYPNDGVERQLETIDRIYQYAIENGIKYVMIVGDITDKHTMRDDTKALLCKHFVKYDDHITSIYIGGNHDWSDVSHTSMDFIKQMTDWKMLKNLKIILRAEQLTLDGIVCNFLPYPTPPVMKNKKPCLNFCHVETAGALGDNGRPLKTDKTIGAPKKDYTISGHIHLYQDLESQRFLYNGSPFQKTFGESLPKGFCHVKAKYIKDELKVIHKFIDSKPGFRLETVIIADQGDWNKLQITPAIRYRVVVSDGIAVPADIRTRIPNIAQLNVSKNAVNIEDLDGFDVTELELLEVDPKDGLRDYLKSAGLRKAQRQQGAKIVDKILSKIGK